MNNSHKIKPLDKYLNEDFYNPFKDDEDERSKNKTSHITDKSGPLKLRKEVFNINRVEYSKRDNGGYTVLAKTQFARGEIVEICPIIFVGQEVKSIKILKDYVFEIDKEKGTFGVVCGYGMLYSHSQEPNVSFAYNKSNRQMYFLTNRPIKVGEELTINYGVDYWTERTNFNLMSNNMTANTIQPIDVKQNESEVQPNAEEMQDKTQSKVLASPGNPSNPGVSGQIIQGVGQQ
jgi:hypothetical protein